MIHRLMVLFSCFIITVSCFGVLSCFESAPDKFELQTALDLMEKKEYTKADEILKELIPKIKDSDTKSNYHYVAATSYRKQKQWEKAIHEYKSALQNERFILADLARLHIASAYRQLEDYIRAVEWYMIVAEQQPANYLSVEASFQVGECFFDAEEYEEAINFYSRFVTVYPDEELQEATYKIAKCHHKMGNLSEAVENYLMVFQYNPRTETSAKAVEDMQDLGSKLIEKSEDYLNYGKALYYNKDYKDAITHLKKAQGENINISAEAVYYTAESYFRERDYTSAIKEYERVISQYSESGFVPGSQYQIAICYLKKNQLTKSNKLLEQFVMDHPESSLADNALFQIAENYRDKNNYPKAVEFYLRSARDYPDSNLADDSMWKAAWLTKEMGDIDKSVEIMNSIIQQIPYSIFAGASRFWIGVMAEKAGNWSKALDAYILSVNSKDWYYSHRAKIRIRWLADQGKIKSPAEGINTAMIKQEELPELEEDIRNQMSERSALLWDLKIFDDAVRELLSLLPNATEPKGIYYYLSVCYEKTGDYNNSWRYAWRFSNLLAEDDKKREIPLEIYKRLYLKAYWNVIKQ
ncbi:tetratricopeptide repeat protein, partial [Candidatus Poribacteria bacterium]|nr:tetratricopeptide repeat protein [Candidatus Poribacteria bacterium]